MRIRIRRRDGIVQRYNYNRFFRNRQRIRKAEVHLPPSFAPGEMIWFTTLKLNKWDELKTDVMENVNNKNPAERREKLQFLYDFNRLRADERKLAVKNIAKDEHPELANDQNKLQETADNLEKELFENRLPYPLELTHGTFFTSRGTRFPGNIYI